MKKSIAVALGVSIWLAAVENASAQSALKKLEQMIRAQRGAAAEDRPAAADQEAGQGPKRAAAGGAAGQPAREKGYLGITVDDRRDQRHGVRVSKVVPGGPADKAGIRPHDLITSLGGVPVRRMEEMAAILGRIAPGDVLQFEVLRDAERHRLEVTFGRRPSETEGPRQPDEPAAEPPPKLVERITIRPPTEKPPAKGPEVADLPQDDHALLKMLQRRIEQLEARVEQLERALRERN